MSVNSETHVVTHESRNIAYYFGGAHNGVGCVFVHRNEYASIYVSVCICTLIHRKK